MGFDKRNAKKTSVNGRETDNRSLRSTSGACGMPGKILLSAFFAMLVFPVPAADADHNRNAVKAAGQLLESLSRKLLNTERYAYFVLYTQHVNIG